jgi:hypothetical protein
MLKWFDVSLYSYWPVSVGSGVIADATARVLAKSAFLAIEGLMRHCGMRWAVYVVAYAEDHSMMYRGYRVVVRLDERVVNVCVARCDVFRASLRRKKIEAFANYVA